MQARVHFSSSDRAEKTRLKVERPIAYEKRAFATDEIPEQIHGRN